MIIFPKYLSQRSKGKDDRSSLNPTSGGARPPLGSVHLNVVEMMLMLGEMMEKEDKLGHKQHNAEEDSGDGDYEEDNDDESLMTRRQ